MACAASSKYLDYAGDGYTAGHLPRCYLPVVGSTARALLHARTASPVAFTCCLRQNWSWDSDTLMGSTTALDFAPDICAATLVDSASYD